MIHVYGVILISSGDQSHTSYKLLYHVMTLLKNCAEKAFELVIDLTHATSLNEPDVSLLAIIKIFIWYTIYCILQCMSG